MRKRRAGKNNFIGWITGIFIVLILSGCAMTLGSRFDESRVGEIESGVTTKDQIKELFGPPESVGLKDGRPLWTYLFAQIPILGGTAKGTVLSIEFDENNIVESYSYIPY